MITNTTDAVHCTDFLVSASMELVTAGNHSKDYTLFKSKHFYKTRAQKVSISEMTTVVLSLTALMRKIMFSRYYETRRVIFYGWHYQKFSAACTIELVNGPMHAG